MPWRRAPAANRSKERIDAPADGAVEHQSRSVSTSATVAAAAGRCACSRRCAIGDGQRAEAKQGEEQRRPGHAHQQRNGDHDADHGGQHPGLRHPHPLEGEGRQAADQQARDRHQEQADAGRRPQEFRSRNSSQAMSGIRTRPAPAGAGTPVKKRLVQAGRSALSSLVLKRARRSAMQALNGERQRPADALRRRCVLHRNMIIAGATPKLTKSLKESSSAPNLLEESSSRAMRPSRASKIGGDQDGEHAQFPAPQQREADAGQARAERRRSSACWGSGRLIE